MASLLVSTALLATAWLPTACLQATAAGKSDCETAHYSADDPARNSTDGSACNPTVVPARYAAYVATRDPANDAANDATHHPANNPTDDATRDPTYDPAYDAAKHAPAQLWPASYHEQTGWPKTLDLIVAISLTRRSSAF